MPPDIKGWNVEDGKFWEATGKRVAYRNLWISVPGLLCGFAIWLWFGVGDSNFASSMSNSSFSSSATSTSMMWPAKPGPT